MYLPGSSRRIVSEVNRAQLRTSPVDTRTPTGPMPPSGSPTALDTILSVRPPLMSATFTSAPEPVRVYLKTEPLPFTCQDCAPSSKVAWPAAEHSSMLAPNSVGSVGLFIAGGSMAGSFERNSAFSALSDAFSSSFTAESGWSRPMLNAARALS